jgi:hypothetical protein
MHLCLAQLLDNQEYVRYYRHRAGAGDYIILDNGAHEGKQYDLQKLLQMARMLGASEVVIPDVPHNTELTLQHFYFALESLENGSYTEVLMEECHYPRLMYVPQVPLNDDAFTNFLKAVNRMNKRAVLTTNDRLRFTLGVPLMYEKVAGGLHSLLDRITWCIEETGIEVHLLGWSRDLTTPIDIAHDFPGVRSCDSAKPFVFAKHGMDISECVRKDNDSYPGRPSSYFTDPLTKQEVELARRNVDFCVRSLEYGNLPPLPESTNTVST